MTIQPKNVLNVGAPDSYSGPLGGWPASRRWSVLRRLSPSRMLHLLSGIRASLRLARFIPNVELIVVVFCHSFIPRASAYVNINTRLALPRDRPEQHGPTHLSPPGKNPPPRAPAGENPHSYTAKTLDPVLGKPTASARSTPLVAYFFLFCVAGISCRALAK